jgi:hypothetical protein
MSAPVAKLYVVPAPSPTTATIAEQINEQHRLGCACAETAVRHAIRCGELLIEQQRIVGRGGWVAWIAQHCEFRYSTATRYIAAAKRAATGVAIHSLSALFHEIMGFVHMPTGSMYHTAQTKRRNCL